jgi:hypothetical protein
MDVKSVMCCVLCVGPGSNVIKLFLSVIYDFSYQAKVFVRLRWKKLARDKHSSLLRTYYYELYVTGKPS